MYWNSPNVEKIELSREELYEKVWSEPMRTLAPKFGLSDVGLAKVCKKYKIPRPGLGYWAKKESGKAVKQVSLPDFDGPEEIVFRKRNETEDGSAFPGAIARAIEFEKSPENYIEVCSDLRKPHPLIRESRAVRKDQGRSLFLAFFLSLIGTTKALLLHCGVVWFLPPLTVKNILQIEPTRIAF